MNKANVIELQKKEHYFEVFNDDIKQLIKLSSRQFDHFQNKLRAYILFCEEKIQFEHILISSIKNGKYTIIDALTEGDLLKPGDEFDLADTICNLSYQNKKTIVEPNIKGTPIANLPSSKFLNVQAVICAPLFESEEVIGALTLCATSEKKDTEQINYFTNMAELVALQLSKDIMVENQKKEIQQSNNNLFLINDHLNRLVNIFLKHKNIDDLFLSYINFAKQITGFENGLISYVDDQHYELIQLSTLNKKFKKGDVFQLCDTLCKEVIEQEKPVFHGSLKGKAQYNLPGRALLQTQSVIGFPLYVNNKLWGTFSLCSTSEKTTNLYEKNKTILQLLTLKISRVLQDYEFKKKIKSTKNLLQLGEDFSQIATYKRYLNTNVLECTLSFFNIFELSNQNVTKETVQLAMSKVIEEDKTKVMEFFKRSATESIEPFEYRIANDNNEIKWLRHQLRLVKNENYILGVVQDTTQLKQIELKLKNRNEELEQLAYASAHDLQEPLRTITSFIEVLQLTSKQKLDAKASEYFTFISDAAYRMKQQIDGILDHARIGHNKQKTKVDMQTLIKSIINDLDAIIKEKDAEIIVDQLPTVYGFNTELRLLFMNLLSNAIKFSHKKRKPVIFINFKEEELYWTFKVKDNGIGMDKNEAPKIFKLFRRLNDREEYEGTGIGLAQAKKIVNLHNGNIYVESVLNLGSTFLFTIKK